MTARVEATCQHAARLTLERFEQATRPATSVPTADAQPFWRVKDRSEQALTDAIREAHAGGDILPDDRIYGWFVEALEFIAQTDDGYEWSDVGHEFADDVDV